MTTITALPIAPDPNTDDAATFAAKAAAFTQALPGFGMQANLVASETNAAATSAASVVNATKWAGTTTSYTNGQAVYSGVNYLTYRLKTASLAANAANADPSTDTTNWAQVAGTGDVTSTTTQTITGAKTFSSATINGGAINTTPIGGTTPAAGAFTTLSASGATTLSGNVTLGVSAAQTTTLNAALSAGGTVGTAGQILRSNGSGVAPAWAAALVSLTNASNTGTAVEFTGIPAWAKRITLSFNATSTSGTNPLLIQAATGGVYNGTNYSAGYVLVATGPTVTALSNNAGFYVSGNTSAADARYGQIILTNIGGNVWICGGVVGNLVTSVNASFSYGGLALGGTLDRIRVLAVGGTDTFDNGSIGIFWE